MITKAQVLEAIEATLDEIDWIDIHAGDFDSKDLEMIGSSQSLTADVLTRKLNEVLARSASADCKNPQSFADCKKVQEP